DDLPLPRAPLSPYTTLFRSQPSMAATLPLVLHEASQQRYESLLAQSRMLSVQMSDAMAMGMGLSVSCSEDAAEFGEDDGGDDARSEEHTSELQSRENLVCRL